MKKVSGHKQPIYICFEHDHSVADYATHYASWHNSFYLKYNNSISWQKVKKSIVNNTLRCFREKAV